MRVIKLATNPRIYSGNAFLVLGAWSTIKDVNTLIDTGSDDYIIDQIENTYTGVGKNKIDQIVVTHSHFDHIGGVLPIKGKYSSEVLSYSNFYGCDRLLKDGEELRIGGSIFEVIHTPAHSSDSICLYCAEHRALFTGDTAIRIYVNDNSYPPDHIDSIERLSKLKIDTVYPGHGDIITEDVEKILKTSLAVMKSN